MATESSKTVIRGALIAAIVAILLFAFSPQATRPRGALKEPGARTAMPEFALPTMQGAMWKLSDNRGKVLFVNFWATWCPPCRAETPALVNLANRYRAHGFEVIGITMDDDPDAVVPSFTSRYKVDYPILVPTVESSLAGAIQSLPTSFLLDKQGRVARTYVGAVDEGDVEDNIRQLLAE